VCDGFPVDLSRFRDVRFLFSLVLAGLATPSPVYAYTQWSAAITVGGGGRLAPAEQRTVLFCLGLRADVLLGPRDPFSVRVGPFVSGYTHNFDGLVLAMGASVLLPVSSTTPIVLSLGVATEAINHPVSIFGTVGRFWWGTRSLNYHSNYGMSAGVWLETLWLPTQQRVDMMIGIDADLGFLSLPIVFLVNWISHARRQ
jgi:hypothetical protein